MRCSIRKARPDVTGFSAGWLSLREPADHAARSLPLTRAVVGALSTELPCRVLDLAAGTGSNVRYLAGHLPSEQRWLLVDHDPALLAIASRDLRRDRPMCHVDVREWIWLHWHAGCA